MNAFRSIWVVAVCSTVLLALLAPHALHSAATQEPTLSIPADIVSHNGEFVQTPVEFASGGHDIAGIIFSIDFDESCLAFDAADGNGDGIPDGVRFQTPGGFRATASFDASDTDGELDVSIVDFSPPFGALPDQTLLELDFTVICTPAPGETRIAPVAFSTQPRPSYSDSAGRDVAGSSQDGAVIVLGSQAETPTPADTPAPIATATGTVTSTATATSAATATPPETATPAVTETPTGAATPTPTAASTSLPSTATPTPPPSTEQTHRLFLPITGR